MTKQTDQEKSEKKRLNEERRLARAEYAYKLWKALGDKATYDRVATHLPRADGNGFGVNSRSAQSLIERWLEHIGEPVTRLAKQPLVFKPLDEVLASLGIKPGEPASQEAPGSAQQAEPAPAEPAEHQSSNGLGF